MSRAMRVGRIGTRAARAGGAAFGLIRKNRKRRLSLSVPCDDQSSLRITEGGDLDHLIARERATIEAVAASDQVLERYGLQSRFDVPSDEMKMPRIDRRPPCLLT